VYFGLFLLLCVPTSGLAADDSFVFSEIAAFESNTKERSEWIEVYNRSNSEVDITGWKFVDSAGEKQTTHRINIPDGVSPLVAPGAYAIVAQHDERFHATYPDVSVQVFDSSWGSLNEGGEYLALLDAEGNISEAFTYGVARSHSLERVDVMVDDYSEMNWKELEGHSAGLAYNPDVVVESVTTSTEAVLSDELITEPAPTSEVEPEVETPGDAYNISWGSLRINEYVADPTEYDTEWIEILNLMEETVDLSGWNLMDATDKRSPLSGEIGPGEFLTFDELRFKLNNGGDAIVLLDRYGFVIDRIAFGNFADENPDDNASKAKKPASSARRFDGVSSGSDANDFAPTMTPTRGFSNRIFVPPVVEKTEETCHHETETPEEEVVEEVLEVDPTPVVPTTQLTLSELLPNPPGSDALDEFVEIYNSSDEEMELTGWALRDAAGSSYVFGDETIAAKSYLGITRATTGIALNNTKSETVELLNADEVVVDTVMYETSAAENWVYALGNDLWQWSETATPGNANIIDVPNQKPVASLSHVDEVDQNSAVTLDASDTTDAENDTLQYLWSFGDRSKRAYTSEPTVEHLFAKSGTFTTRVWVSDGYATSSAKSTLTVLDSTPVEAPVIVKTSSPTPAPQPLTSAAVKTTYTISLDEMDARVKGDKVITEGVVLVEPGVLGGNIFYIGNPGVEVYMYSKDFPDLSRGDVVRVTGEISKPYSTTRIKVKQQSDIFVLSHQEEVLAEPTSLGTIGDELIGDVVAVSGEVVETSSSKTVIENDDGVINVVAKDTTGVLLEPTIGDVVEIAGILSKTNSGYRVLPRDENDVATIATAEEFYASSTAATTHTSPLKKAAFPAAAGGMTSVALAMMWKQKKEGDSGLDKSRKNT